MVTFGEHWHAHRLVCFSSVIVNGLIFSQSLCLTT